MKAIFAHDHLFIKDIEGNYYTGASFNHSVWNRYLEHFSEVKVIARLSDEVVPFKNKYNEFNLPGLSFKEIPSMSGPVVKFKNRFKTTEILTKELKNADVLIARLPSETGNMAIDIAKKLNKPYLIEVVGCIWDSLWNYGSIQGKVYAPIAMNTMKKRVKDSQFTIYVTNNFLQKRYPTRGVSVNCSNVELTDFNESILKSRLNKIKDKSKASKVIIGTTASVNMKFKGQQYIIKALGMLKEKGYTNYEYQLVGTGDQDYLKSIAKRYNVADQVKFLGFMSHSDVFEWLETIDLYTQPSRQEGLPRSLIEAMSRGLPSFGANTAGIPELLENEFIFSNTKKNIKEICFILLQYEKENLLRQAKINYNESKKYDKSIIDSRRKKFFNQFKNSNKEEK